jgi:hypothetical protein
MPPMILMRVITAAWAFLGAVMTSCRTRPGAGAPHLGLVRLDVNITGVDPDGVLNDRVDQLDDRRVGHLVRDLLGDAHHFLDIEFLLSCWTAFWAFSCRSWHRWRP